MLEIKNLFVSYGKQPVLEDISFSLVPHKLTVILGKNGCGKSTLVSCINQWTNYKGEIIFSDNNIALMTPQERAKIISILPQNLENVHITVEELVSYGRLPYLGYVKKLSDVDKKAVNTALEYIGITNMKNCFVDEISGGERQKAYLAMILAQNTRILVLDEPTTYMDNEYENQFLKMILQMKTEHKKTILMIMHNLTQAINVADNIVILDKRRVVFFGSKKKCLEKNIIENIFNVKRYTISDNSTEKIFFSAD